MTISTRTSPTPEAPQLQLALCARCSGLSFPPQVPGCHHCGAPASELHMQDYEGPLRLLNFVTVHATLTPGLPVPAVIGEVALAPDLVEEVLIDVGSEDELRLGMALEPVWQPGKAQSDGTWVFRAPAAEVAS
ncbi:conserved hypothetical protein [Verminephrobacter eiseniae EF01-2]|uniref:DUF35 domain-containing protein n=2 Tax=Verminephrobacter eiseniae TaxID=364317 RepID=A1WPM0_VEREI|nr:conserved hypothetical protein [Verminephrobacter eiseniae EF01-2]